MALLFKGKLIDYAKSELNKNLNSRLDVSKISFTAIKKFPMVSVELKDLVCYEPFPGSKDTLFSASNLFLQFNIWDLWRGNYHLRKITLKNANVQIKIDKDGKGNYQFWKTSTDTTEQSDFLLNLQSVHFTNTHFLYADKKNKIDIEFNSKDLNLKGEFGSKEFDAALKGDLNFTTLYTESFAMDRSFSVLINTKAKINTEQGLYLFYPSNVVVENLNLTLNGSYAQNGQKLKLNLNSKKADISSLMSLLPQKIAAFQNEYKSEGTIGLELNLEGSLADNQSLNFNGKILVERVKIKYQKTGKTLHNFFVNSTLTGEWKNGNLALDLQVSDFSGNLDRSSINGSLTYSIKTQNSLRAKLLSDIYLSEIKEFITLPDGYDFSGSASVNLAFEGSWGNSSNLSWKDIIKNKISGNVVFDDVFFALSKTRHFENLFGTLVFDGNNVSANALSLTHKGSKIQLNGTLRNLIAYLLNEQKIGLDATIKIDKLDLAKWLQDNDDKTTGEFFLTFDIPAVAVLNATISELSFGKFKATDVRGMLSFNDKRFAGENLRMKAMEGDIAAELRVEQLSESLFGFQINGNLNNLNIKQMFYELDNFGQNSLQDKHISGKLNTQLNLSGRFNSQLDILLPEIKAVADMTISNGEMLNYEPLNALAKFVDMKELNHIKFATLTNTIFIEKEKVVIPAMEIQSSALNLQLSGSHSFKNDLDYHFSLLFNDVLTGFFKIRNKKKESEFGEIIEEEQGKARIFVKMTGTVDKPIVSYDFGAVKKKWKEDAKQEKQNLKQVLANEFGVFKKDSVIQQKIESENRPQTEKQVEKQNRREKNKVKNTDDFQVDW